VDLREVVEWCLPGVAARCEPVALHEVAERCLPEVAGRSEWLDLLEVGERSLPDVAGWAGEGSAGCEGGGFC
jgi:hypothetical protein